MKAFALAQENLFRCGSPPSLAPSSRRYAVLLMRNAPPGGAGAVRHSREHGTHARRCKRGRLTRAAPYRLPPLRAQAFFAVCDRAGNRIHRRPTTEADKTISGKKRQEREWREDGDPYGTRTRVSAVKGRRPRPLDEGATAMPALPNEALETGQVFSALMRRSPCPAIRKTGRQAADAPVPHPRSRCPRAPVPAIRCA